MIIVRSESFRFAELKGADSILFIGHGSYYYVEQSIVENELRVLGNWKISERTICNEPWLITWNQGTEIPQELGDYLVAHQNNNKGTSSSKETED